MEGIANNADQKTSRSLFSIFIIICFANILFNILGLPAVKYLYLTQTVLLGLLIITSDKTQIFWALALFTLFEGQGRVLWGYNIIFRLIFDILLAGLIIRSSISSKKLINREVVPNYLVIGIFFHFIWFALELFNPNGAGFIAGIATSKIFIFPFLFFFFIQNFPINLMEVKGQKMLLLFNIFLFLTSIIVIIQNQLDENFLYGISENYRSLFSKYSAFTGLVYRPWGLSFIPGGMSVLFYLTIPFLLLFRPSIIVKRNPPLLAFLSLFKWISISSFFFASFVSQVRSATLKMVLIVASFAFLKFIGSRLKFKRGATALIFLFVFVLTLPLTSSFLEKQGINIDGALGRYEGLMDSGMLANRANFDTFMDIFDERIELPFGYGVGMTQKFLPDFEERRNKHLDKPKIWFWSNDNLILFLFLELGLGAFIYLFIIVAVNVSLFSRLITLLRWGELTAFSLLACCSMTVFILSVFNWGSVALPFNPESFYYWFWAGTGFNVYKTIRDKRKVQEKNENLDEGEFDSFEVVDV
jgi:hypothetical protein